MTTWGGHKCYAAFYYDEMEQYEHEIERLSTILKTSGNDYVALNNRGVLFSEIGETEKAVTDLRKACNLSSSEALPHNNLAQFLIKQKKTTEAITSYERAVQIEPKNSSSQIGLADILLSEGSYHDAIKHYTLAITARNDFAYFYAQRAKAFDGLKDKSKANSDRKKANKLDPKRFPKRLGFFRF